MEMRGMAVTPGYWQRDVATGEPFTKDGRLRTGDVGRPDEGGFVHITGTSPAASRKSSSAVARTLRHQLRRIVRGQQLALRARPRRRDGSSAVRGSGRVGLPAGALAGIDRPQVAAVATLQVDQRALVAQQVLPMRGAIRRGALALVAAGVVAAPGAREPGTTTRIGSRINRQHDSPSDPAAHLR